MLVPNIKQDTIAATRFYLFTCFINYLNLSYSNTQHKVSFNTAWL